MDALSFFLGTVGIALLIWVIDVALNSKPLSRQEVQTLSRKRQRSRALSKFHFSSVPQPATAEEKKAMRSEGEFIGCDVRFTDLPARVAGLLKYKKHEWIVVAFVRSFRASMLWWNKGPDRYTVASFLEMGSLLDATRTFRSDTIVVFHNHPNPNPSMYRMDGPSGQDLRSASNYDRVLANHSVSLLEFVCERGIPHLYYASFSDSAAPMGPILDEIKNLNGTGILKNYFLRKELRRKNKMKNVAGNQR